MIARRSLMSTGLLGGLLALGSTAPAGAGPNAATGGEPQRSDEAGLRRIAEEVKDLKDLINGQRQFTEISAIREAQKTFLRANGKLPDFVEVGMELWFGVHDWHVRWQQPMIMGRDALGRYTILLNQTNVILRADVLGSFISVPYDIK